MKFSLINVTKTQGSLVSGYWLQDHIGTLATASAAARATEAANSHKITVAVVASVASPCAVLSYWTGRTRLDINQNDRSVTVVSE